MILVLWLAAVLAATVPGRVRAQTVRDRVKQHVDQELEGPGKPPAKPKPGKPKPKAKELAPPPTPTVEKNTAAPPAADPKNPGYRFDLTPQQIEAATAPEDQLPPEQRVPRRILGNTLRLDFKLDGAYRGWIPQQYDSAEVKVGGYYTWSVSVKGKLFKFLNLHQGYYESNALSGPRTQEAAVAAEVGTYIPKAAWAMGMLGFPLLQVWEPIVRYETRAFHTSATPKIPVCVVNRDTATDNFDLSTCPRSMQALHIISAFETLVLGVRYNSSKESGSVIANPRGKVPPIYFGVGLMSYTKPYQVTIDGATLPDVLFDGRFRGAGLAAGSNIGGGARRLFADVDIQLGLGQVSLTKDLTLNELAPDDWLIGYLQGNLTAGYRFVLFEGPPTVFFTPVLSGGGASFHFLRTKADPDASGKAGDAPNLNWDFLWSARAALEISI